MRAENLLSFRGDKPILTVTETCSETPQGGRAKAHAGVSEMAVFEARFERLELKYLIDEYTADRIRDDIEPFCQPDPHNFGRGAIGHGAVGHNAGALGRDPRGSQGYGISSLYLDSPSLALFYAKERGDPDRLKLRVRSYRGSQIAVLELKRKISDVIDKTRASVDPAQVKRIARGRLPAPSDPERDRFLTDFALTSMRVGAQPTLHVRYDREAYSSSVDTYARVTFDRRVEVQRARDWDRAPDPEAWCSFDQYRRPELRDKKVILELKCQSFVPWWITNLIRSHALKRRSFSKYGVGIYLTGRLNWETTLPNRSARALL